MKVAGRLHRVLLVALVVAALWCVYSLVELVSEKYAKERLEDIKAQEQEERREQENNAARQKAATKAKPKPTTDLDERLKSGDVGHNSGWGR